MYMCIYTYTIEHEPRVGMAFLNTWWTWLCILRDCAYLGSVHT